MDFKNVSIIVKAIFLILFCIQMISSVLASESATFAQIIAATEVAYVLQKTYNSSMIVEPIEQDYVDGLSIKPPNRYGHTIFRSFLVKPTEIFFVCLFFFYFKNCFSFSLPSSRFTFFLLKMVSLISFYFYLFIIL